MHKMVTITRHYHRYVQPLSSAVSCGNDLYHTDNSSASMVIVIRKYSHTCALPHIIATANIWGWHSFLSKLPIEWLLFEGGDYLRAASIQRNMVILFSVNALIWIAIWVAYPTSGCGWIWIRLWIVCVNSCWRGWKWIGCSMWSFSIFLIRLFYLHHSVNTLDNNPFVLTAVSSNVQELSHSLLLYGILSSCELSSGSQQKLWLNMPTVWRPSWPHHPLHPTPISPWYQSLQVLAKAYPMVAEKCNCRVQREAVGSAIVCSHTILSEFAKTYSC